MKCLGAHLWTERQRVDLLLLLICYSCDMSDTLLWFPDLMLIHKLLLLHTLTWSNISFYSMIWHNGNKDHCGRCGMCVVCVCLCMCVCVHRNVNFACQDTDIWLCGVFTGSKNRIFLILFQYCFGISCSVHSQSRRGPLHLSSYITTEAGCRNWII